MTNRTVKSASELASALKNARSGDIIVLEGGNYGKLVLNGRSAVDGISFVAANASKPPVFSEVELTDMSGISFKGITFKGALKNGYGTGTGLEVKSSSNIHVEDCEFIDLMIGALFRTHSKNVSIVDSTLQGIAEDAIRFSTVDGGLAKGNNVSMRALPGLDHKDMIQVANGGSNITLRENIMQVSDGKTHAIYMGNVKAKASLDRADFYKNIVVEDNIILGGQLHGISAGEVDGLIIRGNVLLQHPDAVSQRTVNIPTIHVAKDSVNVTIANNVTHEKPAAADIRWLDVPTPAKWRIVENTIVPTKTTIEKVLGYNPFKAGANEPDLGRPTNPPVSPERPELPDDVVVNIRTDRNADRKPIDVDFESGDTLEFRGFQAGTFKGVSGGNPLEVSRRGDAVRLDSVEDIRELAGASKDVSVRAAGDDLILRVAQSDGAKRFRLEDMADDYFDLAPIRKETTVFDGAARAGAVRVATEVDFAHGDTIVLRHFAENTFKDVRGGNPLDVWNKGTAVRIDSVEDLRELAGASSSVSARVSGDDLILRVAQPGGAQRFVFEDMADAYVETGTWLV